jgi:hypothetical protein
VPDSTKHGPLLGFAFDGFPVYGAYGYSNPLDTTSPVKRMKPGYRLRNIISRTTLPNGTAAAGPAINANIQNPGSVIVAVLGAYKEDYEYVAGIGDLDESNGHFCKTPEYPNGIYCYFATIDESGNPAYPYLTGPTYYGVVETTNTQPVGPSITETVQTYTPSVTSNANLEQKGLEVAVFPNPGNDVLVVQSSTSFSFDREVELLSPDGRLIRKEWIRQGSTMCFFDIQTLHAGIYFIRLNSGTKSSVSKVIVE